ncbi:MAG TPA: lasso RiPP family leader peptide-containing protein [Gemmatimonadales bacterium]|nr:lasso RiPP family leader peptide-containing protein [Gemmatimonadales bacterium]
MREPRGPNGDPFIRSSVPVHLAREEGWATVDSSRDPEGHGSVPEGNRRAVYVTPVLKRLGSVAELTQGVRLLHGTDNLLTSL